MVFVLCAVISNPLFWTEGQLLEVELEVQGERSSSEDGDSLTGFQIASSARYFQPLSLHFSETQTPVFRSDAYLSSILHGPPEQAFLL